MENRAKYFDMMADMGHTKHIGGLAATQALIKYSGLKAGDQVLDVGCGVGIGPVYLAREFGCFVEGVDITPRMFKHAADRAARYGVAKRIAFRVADMHALPFRAGFFDVALAESVLSFSANPLQVVLEMARVVKPGGYVAFTEAAWLDQPPPEKADFMAKAVGTSQLLLTNDQWREILVQSGLTEIRAEVHAFTALEEARNQARRLSVAEYLRTFGRFFKVLGNPAYREVYQSGLQSMPRHLTQYMGYGIYGGRKG